MKIFVLPYIFQENKSEGFSEIAVNQVKLRFAKQKEHETIRFISDFVIIHKNFLENFFNFWFVLFQDKMNIVKTIFFHSFFH